MKNTWEIKLSFYGDPQIENNTYEDRIVIDVLFADAENYVVVDELYANGQNVNFNPISVYKTNNGAKKSFGYLDEPGQFVIKPRIDPVTQDFINYIIDTINSN